MELSYWGISPNIPAWPTDENGEREQAVLLAHTAEDISLDDALKLYEEAVKLGLSACDLSEQDLDAFLATEEEGESSPAEEGGAGKVINGFSGFGVGLYVPASMAEDAQNLLASMPMPDEAGE